MSDYEMYELRDVGLQSGLTLRHAKLAYKTYGKLNPARDNVIVMPTFYGGQHADTEAMMGAGRDPQRESSSTRLAHSGGCDRRRGRQ
jgi:homoserine O-acetyltransferase